MATRTAEGKTDGFKVLVSLHQGSVLMCTTVYYINRSYKQRNTLRFAMGITVCRRLEKRAQSEDELWQRLLTWKSTSEAKGLKVNVSK